MGDDLAETAAAPRAGRIRSTLGGFASFWGVVGVLLAWGLVQGAAGHLRYLLAPDPHLITSPAQLAELRVERPFRIRLPLDYAHGVQVRDALGGDGFALTPVAGTWARFIVLQKGRYTERELRGSGAVELAGRVVGPGFFDDWDAGTAVGATSVDVPSQMRRAGVAVPGDVLLLVVGWRFTFDEWGQLALGILGAVMLAVFAGHLARLLVVLVRRG